MRVDLDKKTCLLSQALLFYLLMIIGSFRAVQYDNEKSRFSDVLAGFTYDSCCYGLSIYARRYYDELSDKDSADHAIMAEISLNGLSNKGDGRLASLMRNRYWVMTLNTRRLYAKTA